MTSTINTSNSNESTTVSNHSGGTIEYTTVEKSSSLDDNLGKNPVAITIKTASAAALSKKRGSAETVLVTTTNEEDLTGRNNDDVGNNDDHDDSVIGVRCKDEKESLLTNESSVIVDEQQRDEDMKDDPSSNLSLQSNDATMTTPPENENEEAVAIAIDLERPIKRARTAYFLYLDDYRSTVQKENPGASVAVIARILGQRWSALSDENKQPYQKRALIERERVTAATEAWKKAAIAAGKSISSISSSKKDTLQNNNNDIGVASLVLPVGRVRKICRLDPDVRGISKEALLLITKMTEMVTIQLGTECIKTAHIQNRRTLLPQDIVDVCNIRESFFFLKDDITDLHRQQQKVQKATKQLQQQQQIGNTQRKGKASSTTTTTSTTTMKSMTDYFKPVA